MARADDGHMKEQVKKALNHHHDEHYPRSHGEGEDGEVKTGNVVKALGDVLRGKARMSVVDSHRWRCVLQ